MAHSDRHAPAFLDKVYEAVVEAQLDDDRRIGAVKIGQKRRSVMALIFQRPSNCASKDRGGSDRA
jgi:hypothetical protein